MNLRITDVERITLELPFTDRVRNWNALIIPRFGMFEIVRVLTNSPVLIGYGETHLYNYPAGVSDDQIARIMNRNPAEFMTDDSLGTGLQMALFDVVGKALDVPVRSLLGQPSIRDASPIAWWNMDAPPEILADEAKEALKRGYMAHKIKARPWLDIQDQIGAIETTTPNGYIIDIDWNATLLDPGEAIPLLTDLDDNPRIGLYESPIKYENVIGNRRVRDAVQHPLVDHYRDELFPLSLREDALDGFVNECDGAARTLACGLALASVNKNFFLQMTGTGITTAFALHLAAVLTHARWPMVTAMNTYVDDLLSSPIVIVAGDAKVPEGPGLGIELDEAALDKYRFAPSDSTSSTRRLVCVHFPSRGTRRYIDFAGLYQEAAIGGIIPTHEPGVRTEVIADDGSSAFDEAHARAASARCGVWDESG